MTRSRPIALVLASLALAPCVVLVRADDRPADALLGLTPPDALLTVVVEGLREQSSRFLDSPLAAGLAELPAYQAWKRSAAARQFGDARREIQAVLGVDLETIRDEFLGDAVVLTLDQPPGDPESARGLLLTRVRDRRALESLIRRINAAERASGTLREVVDRSHRGVSYRVRRFAEGAKPDESYAILEGDVFAWSNSEDLIRGAIERRRDGGGLASDERFRAVRDAMPAGAVASLYLDPRLLRQPAGVGADGPGSEGDDPFGSLARRYLDALTYVGVALELRDGLVLHTHESLDPSKLDEPLRRWASRPGDAEGLLRRAPADPVVLAAGHVDFAALADEVLGLLDESQTARAENLLLALSGLVLGKDPRTEILPQLGPGVIAYLVRDDAGPPPAAVEGRTRLALVVGLEIAGGSGVSAAVENGLRTVLALATLDPKRAEAGMRVEVLESEGIKLTVLRGSKVLLAYYVEPGLLALGTSARAVSDFARGRAPGAAGSTLAQVRARDPAGARTFLYADLEALARLAEEYRDALAARMADDRGVDPAAARKDLDQVLALARLFRAGYVTRLVDPEFRSAHHTIGLVAREPPASN